LNRYCGGRCRRTGRSFAAASSNGIRRGRSRHSGRVGRSATCRSSIQVVFEDTDLPDHAGETYHGYAGIARATEQWVEAFESVDIELERIEGSGDRLVSIHRLRMKARHTGIEFESGLAYIWTFREGRVVHIEGFLDPAEALEAAGLSD